MTAAAAKDASPTPASTPAAPTTAPARGRGRGPSSKSTIPCTVEGCTRTFTRKNDMKRHVETQHHGKRPFVCPACTFRNNRRDLLRRHFRAHPQCCQAALLVPPADTEFAAMMRRAFADMADTTWTMVLSQYLANSDAATTDGNSANGSAPASRESSRGLSSGNEEDEDDDDVEMGESQEGSTDHVHDPAAIYEGGHLPVHQGQQVIDLIVRYRLHLPGTPMMVDPPPRPSHQPHYAPSVPPTYPASFDEPTSLHVPAASGPSSRASPVSAAPAPGWPATASTSPSPSASPAIVNWCPMNCGARFLEFADLLAHIQSAHQYRLVTCPNLSCNMVLSSEHLRHHWDRHPACLHAIWPRRATDAAIDALLRDVYGPDDRSTSPPHAQASARAPVLAAVSVAQQPAVHVVHHASNSSLHSDYSGNSQDSVLARSAHPRHQAHLPVQLPPIHTVLPGMHSPPPPPMHHQGVSAALTVTPPPRGAPTTPPVCWSPTAARDGPPPSPLPPPWLAPLAPVLVGDPAAPPGPAAAVQQGPLPPVSMLVADEGIALPGPPRTPTYLDHASAYPSPPSTRAAMHPVVTVGSPTRQVASGLDLLAQVVAGSRETSPPTAQAVAASTEHPFQYQHHHQQLHHHHHHHTHHQAPPQPPPSPRPHASSMSPSG
ncbi:hypothetical protein GGF32_002798 [Allomyces javanicus]|nr:hypothetical protein GGF32_002798 [Allomyces javanicus]